MTVDSCVSPQALDALPIFDVVIVCEDVVAGQRAMETYGALARKLGGQCRFSHQMWNFDVLADTAMRDTAAAEAARADVLMLSFGPANRMSVTLKFWLEQWLDVKTCTLAVVVLFADPRHESEALPRLRDYLAGVARRGNMEFFALTGPMLLLDNPAEPAGFCRLSQANLDALDTLAA